MVKNSLAAKAIAFPFRDNTGFFAPTNLAATSLVASSAEGMVCSPSR